VLIFHSAFRLLLAGLPDARIRGNGVSVWGHAPAKGSLDPLGCRETRPGGALRQPRVPLAAPGSALTRSDAVSGEMEEQTRERMERNFPNGPFSYLS